MSLVSYYIELYHTRDLPNNSEVFLDYSNLIEGEKSVADADP